MELNKMSFLQVVINAGFFSDGLKDENVFDIIKGTSINIFIKNRKKQSKDIAEVNYLDVYGLRIISRKKWCSLLSN